MEDTKQGITKLDNPTDFVRLELETALTNNIPIIPILVAGASALERKRLPDMLEPLVYIQASVIDVGRDFDNHMMRLIDGIEGLAKQLTSDSRYKAFAGRNQVFVHSNLQITDRGMRNQLRLNKKIDDLQKQWELLNEKLSGLNEQWILETRVEEKLRLRKSVDDTKTQRDRVEEQLKEMEKQLAKVYSDAKEAVGQNDDQDPFAKTPVSKINFSSQLRSRIEFTYYVGVECVVPSLSGTEQTLDVLCIAPFGMEEGTETELPQEVGLVVGEPVRFHFFKSSVRRNDLAGTVLKHWEPNELEEFQIEATISTENCNPGEVVPVRLKAVVGPGGILKLEAVPYTGSAKWYIEAR